MHPGAEGDVTVGLASDVEGEGPVELGFVAVAGGVHQQDCWPSLMVIPRSGNRQRSSHEFLDRTRPADHFLDRAWHKIGVLAQQFELVRVL